MPVRSTRARFVGVALITVVSCVAIAGCAGNARLPDVTESDAAAIEAFTRSYAARFAAEDADGLLALMTPDFTVLSHGRAPIEGRARVAEEIRGDFARMRIHSLRFENDAFAVCGDQAWVRGRSTASFTVGDDAAPTDVRGSYLWILRRDADGAWRIACDSAHLAE